MAEGLQYRREACQEGCRTDGEQTGGIQDWRNAGQEGCKAGARIQDGNGV